LGSDIFISSYDNGLICNNVTRQTGRRNTTSTPVVTSSLSLDSQVLSNKAADVATTISDVDSSKKQRYQPWSLANPETLCKPRHWAAAEPLGSAPRATAGPVAASVQLYGSVRTGTDPAGGGGGGGGIRTSGFDGGQLVARFSTAKGRRSSKAAAQHSREEEREGGAGRGGGKVAGRKVEGESEEERITRKQQLLEQAVAQLRAKFGREAVMVLGGTDADLAARRVPVIPSGSIALDAALGIGGFPRGRVVEIYGPEATGKTTLALHVVAEAQKRGGAAYFVDAEHSLDVDLAKALGVDMTRMHLSQPDSGETGLALVDQNVRSGAYDVIVVDSVAALVPQAELEGEMGDSFIALQARMMSQALRKLSGALNRAQAVLIFVNQVRSKLAMGGPGMGMPVEVTSGGNALKFYASLRLHIKRVGQLKQGEKVVGNRVRVTVNKNKLAPPFRTAEFDLEFGHGISKQGELLDLGVREGLLTLSGAWYKKGGEVIGQGKEGARKFLKENVEVARELEEGIRERMGGGRREEGEGKKGGVVGENDEGIGEEESEEGEEVGSEGEGSDVALGVAGGGGR
ncbi:hypothetical protein CLOM_g21219, partial [Closterium sp. NIES-68]